MCNNVLMRSRSSCKITKQPPFRKLSDLQELITPIDVCLNDHLFENKRPVMRCQYVVCPNVAHVALACQTTSNKPLVVCETL